MSKTDWSPSGAPQKRPPRSAAAASTETRTDVRGGTDTYAGVNLGEGSDAYQAVDLGGEHRYGSADTHSGAVVTGHEGSTARWLDPFDPLAPIALRSRALEPNRDSLRLGPLEKIYLIWMVGGSCDGCTVAVSGATHPRLEHLLSGIIPGLPRVELIHTVVSMESGPEWVHNLFMAERGEMDAPYVVCWEGSIMDESISGDGYWMGLGEDPDTGRQITSLEWLDRLAPGAAAVVAVGTCATWGGIPGAHGNVTNSMGMMDYLGKEYRSAFGVPVVNVPGCSPIGDNVLETAAAVLLFLNGLAPLPEFDELGRPAWLFGETVHRHCPRAGYYEEGVFAKEYGDKECLVELGCWGPVVQCNIAERGIVDGHGGCMNMGGICIGCTMPGFPDKFSPIYQTAPGSLISSTTSRTTGAFIRRFRKVSQVDKNMTVRWDKDAPSGWARSKTGPRGSVKAIHKFYGMYQHRSESNH
ncbi:MAG: hydrogenase expression protein HypE [Actinomycetota bacterium]|nr:hydrogenase expression protein HypE [Actinomycetota bacterium]